MIAILRGKVLSLSLNKAIIDTNGVGYEVIISPTLISRLELGSDVTVHTSAVIREDSWTLYGFSDLESKELFIELQGVTGIGPKAAYSMLSALAPSELQRAIGSGESATLEQVPGVGKKMASRIILELKDRYSTFGSGRTKEKQWHAPVLQALIGLGFSAKEGESAIESAQRQSNDDFASLELSEILKRTLSQSKSKK